MNDFNSLLLKLMLVLVTAPAWWPFLKAVWEEFNEAMADEGGLFGRIPSAKELADIERRSKVDPLVHEAWPSAEERQAGRRGLGARGIPPVSTSGQSGPQRTPLTGHSRRNGFR